LEALVLLFTFPVLTNPDPPLRPTSGPARLSGFTLVEIMVVVAVIALLAAIAVPSFLRSRKRSQAATIKNELRLIDDAIAQYAIETNKKTGDAVFVDDWIDYLKDGRLADTGKDLFGRDYADQSVDSLPYVPGATYDALSDVADSNFWSPYAREVVARKATKVKKKKH
jgi:prepilin-type N-terminal cleavage/methylation domain-containing protein